MITIPRFTRLRQGLCLGVALSFVSAAPWARLNAAAVDPVPPLITKDKVANRVGTFRGGSAFSANGAGRSGAQGDYSVDFSSKGSGPVYVADGGFFNGPAANDEVTVAFWAKKYDIAAGSAFWFNSPGSNNGQRGYQAHVPWSDSVIYFDTAGCCDGSQRISQNIDQFPDYTGDIGFWTNSWHHFAFSKKGGDKQIWIDGKLFLEQTEGAAPLPTDFVDLYIGSDTGGGNLYHALVDDFTIFSTQLSEAELLKLAGGTSPSALPAADGLVAFWDFNDFPPEGSFILVTPTPNTTAGSPNTIQVIHVDGTTPWTQQNVSLALDGTPVTATFAKDGNRATVRYVSPTLLAIQSTHKATLTYPGPNGPLTLEWQFTVGPYTKDSIASRVGVLTGGSSYTSDAGGHSGKPGDYGIDFGPAGTGPVRIDGAFLNGPAAADEMTFALWVKKYDTADSSVFWAQSANPDGVANGERGFQAHTPWSNNNIYFDTAGCCGSDTRLNKDIADFEDYTGDRSWWTNWHYFVFSKKADDKQVWIDGKLFLEGSNVNPLPTDFLRLSLGAADSGGNMHGLIDDFAVFSKQLTEAQIQSLAGGAKASSIDASAGLVAYWDFNDIPPQGIFVSYYPAPDSTNAAPNKIEVVHLQGTSPWDLSKVGLKVDSVAVTPTTSKNGSRLTITYNPPQSYAIGSSHTVELSYPNPDSTIATKTWQFQVGPYTQDKVHKYPGMLLGPTKYTSDGGGYSGKPGDYAIDLGTKQAGQGVRMVDPTPLNLAAANDEMSVVGWQKLLPLVNSAFFFGVAPSANGGARGFGAFPWGDKNIYFDTAGCCDADTQRISAGIDTFPDYSGDVGWWTNWHHVVYQKQGPNKEVWIDGKLFLQGSSTAPLPTDFTEGDWGVDVPDNARLQGVLDDVAIFGKLLDQATIQQLAGGTLPSALPASAKLLAYWDFNDAASTGGDKPVLSISSIAGGKVRITYTGTLESTDALGGTWSAVAGATSPWDVTTAGSPRKFYRARK